MSFFFSCRKNDVNRIAPAPPAPPNPPAPVDTLAAGWKKINFLDSSDLVDIFFINNTGFTISSHIFKSADGGNNWSQVVSPSGLSSYPFANLGMGTESNAIFVEPTNQLAATHDAGVNFAISTLPTSILTDVFFVDSVVAYAVGKSVWKTIDGGSNWTKTYDFPVSTGYNSLFFISEQNGWILKKEGLYNTNDSGVSWQFVNTDTINLGYGGGVFFVNQDTGYISNTYSIQKTVNGGVSWKKVFDCEYTTDSYHDIYFVSDNVGYITDGPRIFKTVNGGDTWTKEVTLASSSRSLIELHFTDADHGWVCGSKGTILTYTR